MGDEGDLEVWVLYGSHRNPKVFQTNQELAERVGATLASKNESWNFFFVKVTRTTDI